MEGFVEVSPLSSAPTSASSDSLIISNDSYVPIHSSSQILVAQDSKELINVEHSEAAVSHTNEKHMNDEKLGKKGSNYNFYILCYLFLGLSQNYLI